MGLFSGIKNAKTKVDAEYVAAGQYLMRIDKVKQDKDRKNVPFFAVEMTCLHVTDGSHPKAHRIGADVTWLIKSTNDYFLPEIKAFVLNVLEEDLDAKSEDEAESLVEAICADDNPMAGTVVELHAREIVLREKDEKGNDKLFTRVSFRREVPFSEVADTLTEQEIERFYPGDQLVKLVEAEAA